jgi:hypothetical protein
VLARAAVWERIIVMHARWKVTLVLIAVALCALTGAAPSGAAPSADDEGFANSFDVKKSDLASSGRSDYCILEPGYEHVYEGQSDHRPAKLVITVLDETRKIDGVETRVVEERESADGQLVEVSRNYLAIDRTNGEVYYFGEDVDEYRDGTVSGHGGSWHSGENGAHFGLFMPGQPKVGQKFYQELAPKVAMDRVEIASTSAKVDVAAGHFDNCVQTIETTPLEPRTKEHKLYGPKVGLLVDGDLKLVKHGMKAR